MSKTKKPFGLPQQAKLARLRDKPKRSDKEKKELKSLIARAKKRGFTKDDIARLRSAATPPQKAPKTPKVYSATVPHVGARKIERRQDVARKILTFIVDRIGAPFNRPFMVGTNKSASNGFARATCSDPCFNVMALKLLQDDGTLHSIFEKSPPEGFGVGAHVGFNLAAWDDSDSEEGEESDSEEENECAGLTKKGEVWFNVDGISYNAETLIGVLNAAILYMRNPNSKIYTSASSTGKLLTLLAISVYVYFIPKNKINSYKRLKKHEPK